MIHRFWGSAVAVSLLGIAGVAGLLLPLLSSDVRQWASDNGSWVLGLASVLVVGLLLVVGYLWEALQEARRDASRAVRPKLVSHDAVVFNRLKEELPALGGVVERLGDGGFRAKRVRWGNLSDLERFKRDWENDATARFVDAELEAARQQLVEKADDFMNVLSEVLFAVDDQEDMFAMDTAWLRRDHKAFYAKEAEIIDMGLAVASAYAEVMRAGHSKGL